MQTTTFNPYSAPETRPDERLLPADTEFLFNDQCVAGIGTITLPKICVLNGSRNELVSRVTRLSWCSRTITWTRNAAIFATVSNGPQLLIFGGRAPHAGWYWLIASVMLSVAVVATIASVLLRSSVTVR